MAYAQSQISAVRKLQELHGVDGTLSDEACKEYLDWHLSTQTAEARGISAIAEAMSDGFANGLDYHEQQFRKLSGLAE